MRKMKINKKTLSIISGAFILIWYIWFRFIRERLPKGIPFELTEFRFILLLFICSLFAYIVSLYIYPRKPNEYILYIKKLLLQSLRDFDAFIKNNNIYDNIIQKYILKISSNILKIKIIYLFIILNIIPRIILITISLIDVFYFQYIHFFYNFIYMAFIPLFASYLYYSMYDLYIEYLVLLESRCSGYLCEEMNKDFNNISEYGDYYGIIDVDTFVTQFASGVIFHNKIYNGIPQYSHEFYEQMGGPKMSDVELTQFYRILNNTTNTTLFLALIAYKWKVISELAIYKYFQAMIYGLYLISWSYILLISVHTLTDIPILKTILDNIEPFSGLVL